MNFAPEIASSGLSVTGPVRENNQDSIHLPGPSHSPELGWLYAVADGMGGYSGGEIASRLTLDTLNKAYSRLDHPDPKFLRTAVESANLFVYQKAQQLGMGRMGTTLTAAYILGNMLYLAHVGDSRAYLIRNQKASCLTADHTVVGDMMRAKLIPQDKVRTHAQRSKLTKAIGLGMFVQPDFTSHRLAEGDSLVLCTDGLWSVIQDDDFARVTSRESTPESVARELIELALYRETDDNASAVVFHISKISEPAADSIQKKPIKWINFLGKFSR